jgi:hypothetical protein
MPETIYQTLKINGPLESGRYALIHNSSGADIALMRNDWAHDSHDDWSFASEADAYQAILAWLYLGELPEEDS